MKLEIVGFGISCVDYTAVVDKIPSLDETVTMVDFSKQMGGPVAVALATFSNLGGIASYIGAIGKDSNGKIIKETLKMFRVDIKSIIEKSAYQTPLSIVLVEKKSGKRTIIFNPGCAFKFKFSEYDINHFKKTRFLHIDGFSTEAAIKAAEWANANNIIVVLDAGFYVSQMAALLERSNIVIASKDFVKKLTNKSNLKEGIKKIKKLGSNINLIAATGGEEGSICLYENNFFYQPAFKVKVLDTTGAGDVFHGAFLFGLAKNWEVQKILEFSSATAALKCMRLGGISGIPNYEEVMDFLKNYK